MTRDLPDLLTRFGTSRATLRIVLDSIADDLAAILWHAGHTPHAGRPTT